MSPARARRSRLDRLLAAGVFGAGEPAVIETHVSWVVLSGEFAYKIKKPVNLGFVDFSTPERRRFACLEELRLNRRLAPDIYLDVVEFAAPPGQGEEPLAEYAVRMRRFPPGASVGADLADSLNGAEASALGRLIGAFHESLPPAGAGLDWGSEARIWQPVEESAAQMAGLLSDAPAREALDAAARFLGSEFAARKRLMAQRRGAGRVRECHGDLHLGNLVRIGDKVLPFDALEFDASLRWIDVLSEVAFLVMDLDARRRRGLAFSFLNAYLDVTGDYAGLPCLRFYLAYRALVRAKVGLLMPAVPAASAQPTPGQLLDYAAAPLPGLGPVAVLMCGVSGSGKSWAAARLAPELPAVWLRSDVERKRLLGLAPLDRRQAAPGTGIYAPGVSARVYRRLGELAGDAWASGLPAIIDATGLRRSHRQGLLVRARDMGVKTAIVHCRADEATLAERIRARASDGRDPSDAGLEVLRAQLGEFEPPGVAEADLVVTLDSAGETGLSGIAARLRALAP